MNELIDKAIAHITEQAMEIKHPFATFIEEHLTNICTTEDIANKLLDESKDLKEFCKNQLDEMREEARKGGTGLQGAGLPDAEFYRRVENYYNINIVNVSNSNNIVKPVTKSDKKIVNIMDLL